MGALNVTGANGYTLGLGAITAPNASDSNNINATTGNLKAASFLSSSSNNSSLSFTGQGNQTFTGAISAGSNHNLALTFSQTGTVTLFGANTISRFSTPNDPTSPIVFNSGTVIFNNATAIDANTGTPNALGATSGSATATVLLGGTDANGLIGGVTFSRPLAVQNGTSGVLTLGGQNTSGTNTFSGAMTLGSTTNTGKSVQLQAAAGGTVNFSGGFLINGTGATTPGGLIVGDATNTGTVRLSGTNTYIGATAVNGGTLQLGSGGSLAATAVTVGSASNATLLTAGTYSIGGAGNGSVALTANTGSLTLGTGGTISTLTIADATAATTALTLGGGNSLNFTLNGVTGSAINLTGSGDFGFSDGDQHGQPQRFQPAGDSGHDESQPDQRNEFGWRRDFTLQLHLGHSRCGWRELHPR